MSTAILDAGALIAFERNDRFVVAIVARALKHHDPLVVPAGVVAQTWRDGRRQTRLARLLGSQICTVLALDDHAARAAGQLCGTTGISDIVDASVVIAARSHHGRVITSDPDDIRRLDNDLAIVSV